MKIGNRLVRLHERRGRKTVMCKDEAVEGESNRLYMWQQGTGGTNFWSSCS